jgi:benzodiazapine receptor
MRSEHARHSLEALMATLKSLVPFILLVAVAAAGGALFPPGEWHAALAKPAFNPPNALFAPVWTALYVMMAVAAWRVFRREGWQAPLWLWLAQLVLNAIWTPLFFGLHRIDLALADIIVLDLLVIATTVAFFRRDRLAGWLLVPYLAWILFATALTFAIWRLNPAA